MPTACPFGEPVGEAGCVIALHHFRPRKTGPAYPVAVLRCHRHRRAFTLYPFGHVPYGRVALVPVSPDGEPLLSVEGSAAGELAWHTTVFGAAFDARHGKAWPRTDAVSQPLWQTQMARLNFAATLVGIEPSSEDRLAELIAARLRVPLLQLMETRRQFRTASDMQTRGNAVAELVECVVPPRCLLDRLLSCGVVSGLWREVHRWDRVCLHARRTLFLPGGTPSG